MELGKASYPPGANLRLSLDGLAFSSSVPPPHAYSVTDTRGNPVALTAQTPVGVEPLIAEVGVLSSLLRRLAAMEQQSAAQQRQISAQQHKSAAQQQQLSAQQQQLTAQQQQSELAHTVLLSVVSAQIVTVALGGEMYSTAAPYMRHSAVKQLAVLAGVGVKRMQAALGSLVRARNNEYAHMTSRPALDKRVAACLPLITPRLQKSHYWECWCILSYTKIKKALPNNFQ